MELNPLDERYLQRFIVEPISSHVRQELKLKLMAAQQEERIRVYKLFETVPASRRLAGLVFEAIVQLQLQNQVALTLIPMIKEQTPRKKFRQWSSQSLDNLASTSTAPTSIAPTSTVPTSTQDSSSVGAMAANILTIDFKPLSTIQFPKPRPRPEELSSGIYYVPESPNQVGFDSFIVKNKILYIFQFTIADSHPIKGGLVDFFLHTSLHKILEDKEWYFIFVIPQGGRVVCSESGDEKLKEFWKDVKFFTAEVDPEKKTRVAHGSESNVVSPCIIL